MKNLVLFVFISAIAIYAQNCASMTAEQRTALQDDLWESNHKTVLVQQGIVCDDGYFWTGIMDISKDNICTYYIKTERVKKQINGHYFFYNKNDEFDMTIEEKVDRNTKLTCIDLYKQFKKDIK